MKKSTGTKRRRLRGRHHPFRQLPGNAQGLTDLGLHQILVPDQGCKGTARQHHPADGVSEAASYVVEYVDFLTPQRGKGATSDFRKENNGNPLGCRAHARTGNQPHVDCPRHHDETDEKRPQSRPRGHPVLELGRLFHQGAVLFQIPVLYSVFFHAPSRA